MVAGRDSRVRSFMLAYINHALGYISSGIAGFAVSVWLSTVAFPAEEQKAALAGALSALSLAVAVPTVLGAPVAGTWVDRHDRKRTMILATAGLAAVYAAMMALMGSAPEGGSVVLPLVGLIAISSLAAAFEQSSFDVSCAMLVPVEMLPRANGLVQTAVSLSGAFSPALAGAIVELGRKQSVLMAEALVPAVSALCATTGLFLLGYARIPSPRRDDLVPGARKKSVWKDAGEGASFILERSGMLWLLITFAIVNLASAPVNVLLPLFVKENLMESAQAHGLDFTGVFGLVATVFGIGGIAGGLAVSASGGFRRKRIRGVLFPLILSQTAMVLLGLTRNVFLALGLVAMMSICGPVANAHSTAIWQAITPKAMQGRVFSIRTLIAQFTWPLSAAVAGWAGARFRTGAVMSVLGALSLANCILQLGNRAVMNVEETAGPVESSA